MISEANQREIEAAGLSFILGMRIPDTPYAVTEWRRKHLDEQMPDVLILTQPRPAGPADKRRNRVVYYQYKVNRGRRTLRGIDEQVAKAERAVAGKVPVERNRFIKLVGADKSVNRTLEAKARALAGIKGYITNLPTASAEFVIGTYHRLYEIERSFRMSKHDLAARPIYHHKRESIEAHLSIVFAALGDRVGRPQREDRDSHREAPDGHREDLRQHHPDHQTQEALHAEHEQHHAAEDHVAAQRRLGQQETQSQQRVPPSPR
jgi:hypothetical protein